MELPNDCWFLICTFLPTIDALHLAREGNLLSLYLRTIPIRIDCIQQWTQFSTLVPETCFVWHLDFSFVFSEADWKCIWDHWKGWHGHHLSFMFEWKMKQLLFASTFVHMVSTFQHCEIYVMTQHVKRTGMSALNCLFNLLQNESHQTIHLCGGRFGHHTLRPQEKGSFDVWDHIVELTLRDGAVVDCFDRLRPCLPNAKISVL